MNVGVIGGGTAGSAAALFLARAGHEVDVYERVPEPGPVGAGIVLQPSGMAVLARLGLVDEVVARGSPIHRLYCETPGRRAVVDLSYALVSKAFYGVGMHRGVLFQSLWRAMERERAIRIHTGVEIASLDEVAKKHDLVVVADGAKSHLRGPRARVTPYPWGALWFIGRDEGARFAGRLYQVVNSTRRLMGLLPTGLGPDADNRAPLVTLFWSIRADALDAWKREGLAKWKDELLDYAPAADALLSQIELPEQVLFSNYFDVVMSPWNVGNVVYLGDAAHAMSPQLGQGCNLALFDAMVLADCLAEISELPGALDEYSSRRRAHLGFYQFATRWLTPLFQSDHGWLSPLRNLAMPLMCKVGWFHRQMVTSMCGVSRGPFAEMMPLAANPPLLEAHLAKSGTRTPSP